METPVNDRLVRFLDSVRALPTHPLPEAAPQSATLESVQVVSDRLRIEDFEEKWTAFISSVENPKLYDAGHKAVAKLGYCWAVLTMQKFTSRIHPL